MRRIRCAALIAVVALALSASGPTTLASSRERSAIKTGRILIGHLGVPVSVLSPTGPRYFASCNTKSPLNGIDGVWLNVGGWTHMQLRSSSTLAASVLFYTRDCELAGGLFGPNDGIYPRVGDTVTGPVPAGIVYTFVIGYEGTGTFTLRLWS